MPPPAKLTLRGARARRTRCGASMGTSGGRTDVNLRSRYRDVVSFGRSNLAPRPCT